MCPAIKLKYMINYNHATYNYVTEKYQAKEDTYLNLKEAKANRWRCEKCQYRGGTFNTLLLHKNECHSY